VSVIKVKVFVIDPKMFLFILSNSPQPPLNLRGGEGELLSSSFVSQWLMSIPASEAEPVPACRGSRESFSEKIPAKPE